MNKRSYRILVRDTWRPIYLGVAAFVAAAWIFDIPWPASGEALLGAALTVGSVVIGFLISAKAIILSSNGRGIERVREMGLMIELADAMATAIYLGMFFTVVNTVGFFHSSSRWFEAVWFGGGLAMLYSFLKISRLLFRIVRSS